MDAEVDEASSKRGLGKTLLRYQEQREQVATRALLFFELESVVQRRGSRYLTRSAESIRGTTSATVPRIRPQVSVRSLFEKIMSVPLS